MEIISKYLVFQFISLKFSSIKHTSIYKPFLAELVRNSSGFLSYQELLDKLQCHEIHGIRKQNKKCRCVCPCECDENCNIICSNIQKVLNLVNHIMEKVGDKDPIFNNVQPNVIGSLRY